MAADGAYVEAIAAEPDLAALRQETMGRATLSRIVLSTERG